MTARRFTLREQEAFAALSGDDNPIHLDPVEARRTLFGGALVHGIHAVLWGLDEALASAASGGSAGSARSLASLHASFRSPLALNEPVALALTSVGDALEAALEVRGATAAVIRCAWSAGEPGRSEGEGSTRPSSLPRDGVPGRVACRETVPDEMEARSGRLPLHLDRARAAALFPALARRLDPLQLAQILATTRLVGMECPGRRALFSGLQVHFTEAAAGPGAQDPELAWRVDRFYPGVSLVTMELQSPGMAGSIRAFVRPAPHAQPSMRELAASVKRGEFAGQRALVLGGSRGLGEVTAKLLAAGGASVVVTYRQGVADAQRVVRDIADYGATADSIPWDALAPGDAPPLAPGWTPTHLYYFATPHITPGVPGAFSAELLTMFRAYYVAGLLGSVAALGGRSGDLRAVFCPSSTYVETPPANLAEYAAAKAEGEEAARRLAAQHPGWVVDAPRLPRLATDQTATLLRVPSEEPAPVLLRSLRALHARAGSPISDP